MLYPYPVILSPKLKTFLRLKVFKKKKKKKTAITFGEECSCQCRLDTRELHGNKFNLIIWEGLTIETFPRGVKLHTYWYIYIAKILAKIFVITSAKNINRVSRNIFVILSSLIRCIIPLCFTERHLQMLRYIARHFTVTDLSNKGVLLSYTHLNIL